MLGAAELLEKIFLLTSTVDRIEDSIGKIEALVLENRERITKLEGSGELIAEKAKNAALTAVMQTNGDLHGELSKVKTQIEAISLLSGSTNTDDKKRASS